MRVMGLLRGEVLILLRDIKRLSRDTHTPWRGIRRILKTITTLELLEPLPSANSCLRYLRLRVELLPAGVHTG